MEIKKILYTRVILGSEATPESDSGQARMTKYSGFTLIELLVAIVILATVGIAAAQIFFTTLRGAGKADILKEVRVNGDYALSVMERMIRNASQINVLDSSNCATSSTCPGTGTCLKITNPDGGTTAFSLSGSQIASTGGLLTGSKINASALSFNCVQPAGKPPVVTVSFKLSQVIAGAGPEERAVPVTFQTTVSLRTY